MRRLLAVMGVSLMLGGCLLRVREADGGPPPEMTREEAVSRAYAFCEERGYFCQLKKVKGGDHLWRVELHAETPEAQGKLKLEFSRASYELVKVKEDLKRRKSRRGHGKHDDDDDNHDGDDDD